MEKKEKTIEERLEEEIGEGDEDEATAEEEKGKKKIELDWGMDPSERLRIEMESLQENDQMRLVANERIAEFAKDQSLAEAYRAKKRTLEEVIDYIVGEARKMAVGSRAVVRDEEVYGWAIHYVQDGKEKGTKEKKLSVGVLTKEDEAELVEKAKKDFYDAEMRLLKEEADRKAKKEREKAERKKAAEEAKNRERGYEQVSLFSFSEESEGGKA